MTDGKYIPAVSIGMPVYNGEKYIIEALQSLLAQSFFDFELIISDNCSNDSTESICREFAAVDSRICYIRQVENKGALANFLFVANEARGAYFMWAACDDRWSPFWIERIYHSIVSERNLAGFGQLVHIDESGKPMNHPANGARLDFRDGHFKRKMLFYLSYEGFGKANLFYALFPRHQLKLATFANGYYDYVIIFILLDRLQFAQIQGATLEKRIHGGSEGASVTRGASGLFYLLSKAIRGDIILASHYLKSTDYETRFMVILFMPIKLIKSFCARMVIRFKF